MFSKFSNFVGPLSSYKTTSQSNVVTSRYFKLTINKIKDNSNLGGATQISDLIFQYKNIPINWNVGATASNPSGEYDLTESPDKLLDNNILTKWCDTNFVINGFSIVYIDNITQITFDSYYYITGNDYLGRDPISWILEISDDNTNWATIDTQIDLTITDSRQTNTQVFLI